MQKELEEDIAQFKKKFDYNYQPKYGFCPAILKTNIMDYYDVSFLEAIQIYNEINKYPSAIIRFNDYLFEKIKKN